MDIRDLSIGDWVQARMVKWDYEDLDITPPMRVAEISSDEVMLQLGSVKHYAFVDDLQPIPITAEVLEKNGFEREKYTIDIAEAQEIEYDGYRHILCQDGVQYDIILADSFGGYFDLEIESSCRDDAGERILISSRLSLDYVEFVYQLQHALRLAGVEKEIEL